MRVKVNDTTLFFDVEGAKLVPDGAGMRERPTVLLLHGGPGFDHSNFMPAFSQLADVAQLVYVDHRGNGRSDRGDPSTWRLETWADDVRGLCDALEIDKPIVLGWSFGGFVAQAYATRHPDHPSKLIFQSTAPRMDLDSVVEAFRKVGGDEAGLAAKEFWTNPTDEAQMAYMQHCLPAYSPAPLDMAQMTRCVLNPELLKGFEGEMEMDLRPGLAAVTCPTLVVAGTLDPVTPVAAAEEIVGALTNADVRYEVFEQSGHFIADTEPDRFFTVLREFITS
ncbi:MAG: alpha/beta hydrolase [Actinobacteria bacterium]|nr:alpha/beta hydrolase [Actinomycetota bacterium]